MLKKRLIGSMLMLTSLSAMTQNGFGDLKVVKIDFDSVNRASIIPDSIFSIDVDLLLLSDPFDTTHPNGDFGFEIRWPSTYIDGSFVLTLNKRQISLRSGHDNPNPNFLYWFANLTDEQYQFAARKINSAKTLFQKEPSENMAYQQLYFVKFKPEKKLPKRWTNRKLDRYQKNWLARRYRNLDYLMTFIDDGATLDTIIPFLIRDDFDQIKQVRVVFSEYDYGAQIQLYKPPSEGQ